MLESLRPAIHLLQSPLQAMSDVRKGGWTVPALCLIASTAGLCYLPWPSPAAELLYLKLWGVLQVLSMVSLWAAGWPMGGRGTLAQAARIVALVSLLDGAGLYAVHIFMRHLEVVVHATLVMLYYLAVKALHEFDNDNWAFKVACSALSVNFVLLVKVLPLLGLPLPW